MDLNAWCSNILNFCIGKHEERESKYWGFFISFFMNHSRVLLKL